MRNTKVTFLRWTFFLGMMFFANFSFAQGPIPCDDPFDPNPEGCNPDAAVPIDGGVYYLLAGGILVGCLAFKNQKKTVSEIV